MQMASALLRSGVVTQDDVRRLEVEEKAAQEAEIQARLNMALAILIQFNTDRVLRRNKCGSEIKEWMLDTGKIVPLEVLERWVGLSAHNQTIEWAKWLAAYRESIEKN